MFDSEGGGIAAMGGGGGVGGEVVMPVMAAKASGGSGAALWRARAGGRALSACTATRDHHGAGLGLPVRDEPGLDADGTGMGYALAGEFVPSRRIRRAARNHKKKSQITTSPRTMSTTLRAVPSSPPKLREAITNGTWTPSTARGTNSLPHQ